MQWGKQPCFTDAGILTFMIAHQAFLTTMLSRYLESSIFIPVESDVEIL